MYKYGHCMHSLTFSCLSVWMRFRTDSEHLQGAERLAIMKPEPSMLESKEVECSDSPASPLDLKKHIFN